MDTFKDYRKGVEPVKFIVHPEVFERLPNACFAVVAAYGIDNETEKPGIGALLNKVTKELRDGIAGTDIKQNRNIMPYRTAFTELGFNPNKYLSSIEAMVKRVAKGGDLPYINPVVDLINALSLKYMLPMGAHDIDVLEGDIAVRFSIDGDIFVPLGKTDEEILKPGELVYADNKRIRTRRWIWRQSDRGKVTGKSRNIFFPIDGFIDENYNRMLEARDQLAVLLKEYFRCKVDRYFINSESNETKL